MADNEMTLELAPILNLPPLHSEQMHPRALQRYVAELKELYDEVPLRQLADEDLTDNERSERQRLTDGIVGWIESSAPATYRFSASLIFDMGNLKTLLTGAYKRKLNHQRRRQALVEINPPLASARQFLSDAEYDKFRQTLIEAADAYLSRNEQVESYCRGMWKVNAPNYYCWLLTVEERKQTAARREQARVEHNHFLKEANQTIQRFRKELAREKKPRFAYPARLVRYAPGSWCPLKLPSREEIEKWVRPQIQERLPEVLKGFILWETDWETWTSPSASYVRRGVPCLSWRFVVSVLAEVRLRLKQTDFTGEFCGYRYEMHMDAEDLGSTYTYIGPVESDDEEGFSTPLALLSKFAEGRMEDDGIVVVQHDAPFTTFAVEGFEGEIIDVHDKFRKFIMDITREQPLGKALFALGLIDEDTARLVAENAALTLPVKTATQGNAGSSDDGDVISALEAMGYKKKEIQEMVGNVELSPGMSTEEKIKAVFKNMGV